MTTCDEGLRTWPTEQGGKDIADWLDEDDDTDADAAQEHDADQYEAAYDHWSAKQDREADAAVEAELDAAAEWLEDMAKG